MATPAWVGVNIGVGRVGEEEEEEKEGKKRGKEEEEGAKS